MTPEEVAVVREVRDHLRYHVLGVKAMWYGADQRAAHIAALDRVSKASGQPDDEHGCRCPIYNAREVGA